jgi:8-oxo-dGTP pyrophosphatase MutT (NUDIX family)
MLAQRNYSLKTYYKYALCVIKNNRLLVQEEEGEQLYLLPGGRAEEGEGAIQALCREVREELGIELELPSLQYLGEFEDTAAGGHDALVHIDLYQGDFNGDMQPCSEVKRLVWFDKNDDWSKLAPVTKNKILPALLQKGLLT